MCSIFLFAQSDDSMDELLDTFVSNSDLSEKTRLENAGNVIIFTRQQLERMQARNLKDVLKTLPAFRYSENRWGFPDPYYLKEGLPFNSRGVRIYINDQEITSAAYGSGFSIVGDIDIGFVDHIEVYSVNPSFEYSTEPARCLIKLYSKTPRRDKGGKVEASIGSRGFNRESFQYADVQDDFYYYTYISRLDDRRERYESFGSPLSRDKERHFVFGTVATKGHHFQLLAIQFDRDTFMGLSPEGVSPISEHTGSYLHIGYENRVRDNLNLKITWEKGRSENHYRGGFTDLTSFHPYNNIPPYIQYSTYSQLKYSNDDTVFTTNLQYKMEQLENNKLIVGLKYRHKHFKFSDLEYSLHLPFPPYMYPYYYDSDYSKQNIFSFYFEDHYAFSDNFLLTFGGQFSHVDNNADIEDQDVWLGRIGFIYTNENWVVKTFLHRSEFLVEPYLYIGKLVKLKTPLKPEKLQNITHEIQYSKDNYKIRGILSYSNTEKMIYDLGDVKNYEDTVTRLIGFWELMYRFDVHNSFSTTFSYDRTENYPKLRQDTFEEYKVTTRLLNTIGRFDIYNELIFNHNTLHSKNYVDYSAGIKYRYNENLVISLKGENIFNTAQENMFTREIPYRDPLHPFEEEWVEGLAPLYASSIDQRFYVTVEYKF